MSGMAQLDVNGNFSFEGLVYLHFQINRNNILDDSMEKLGKVKKKQSRKTWKDQLERLLSDINTSQLLNNQPAFWKTSFQARSPQFQY